MAVYLNEVPPLSVCPMVDRAEVVLGPEPHPSVTDVLLYPIPDWVEDLPEPPARFTVGWSGVRGDGAAQLRGVCETYNWATNISPLKDVNVTNMSAVSSLTAPGNARTRLNQSLAPKSDRRLQVDSGTMASIVGGVASFFNPSNAISEQYREGLVARTAMADYYENERIFNMATVTSALVSSWRITSFASTLGVNSVGVSTTQAIPVGAVFTLSNATAAILDVHPETKAVFANAKQFTVVSTVFGATSTITFAPPIFWTGPRQNVGGAFTITSLALSSLTINQAGTTTLTFPTGLMYHKDAFTFATAELPLMAASEKCVRKTYDGLSLRVWQDSDIRNDEMLTRIDILYGFAAIRPEWACRVIGAGA